MRAQTLHGMAPPLSLLGRVAAPAGPRVGLHLLLLELLVVRGISSSATFTGYQP